MLALRLNCVFRCLTVLLLLAGLLLAACGAPPPTASPTPQAAGPAATVVPAAIPSPVIVTLPPRDTPENGQVSLADHTLGPDDAPVVMLHYADFQCLPCAEVARSLTVLLSRYPETLQIIWRHLPDVTNNDKAGLALIGAEAAGQQNRFWEMHDLLFAEQASWLPQTPDAFRQQLIDYAGLLELDTAAFTAALDDPALQILVEQYRQEGQALDIAGIPTLVINGQIYSGRYDLYGLDDAYRLFMLGQRHYDDQPGLVIDLDRQYRARLVTEHGDVELDLFADRAPVTVNNFVFLARQGWYDDITFHRVLPGLFAQTGDPSGTGFGGPGYNIIDEIDESITFDREGRVAMASTRGVLNSGGSQFFITFGPLEPDWMWNGDFAIFGQVTSGMDVLRQLTLRDPLDPVNYPDPPPGDRLLRVEIIEE